jgi:hypothetical protein
VKRALRIAPSEWGASLSRNSWSEIPGAGQPDPNKPGGEQCRAQRTSML